MLLRSLSLTTKRNCVTVWDMMNTGNRFGSGLRRCRLDAGLTLREVASVLGKSISYVSDVERGLRSPFRGGDLEVVCACVGGELGRFRVLASVDRGGFLLSSEVVSDLRMQVGSELMVRWDSLSDNRLKRLGDILLEDCEGVGDETGETVCPVCLGEKLDDQYSCKGCASEAGDGGGLSWKIWELAVGDCSHREHSDKHGVWTRENVTEHPDVKALRAKRAARVDG